MYCSSGTATEAVGLRQGSGAVMAGVNKNLNKKGKMSYYFMIMYLREFPKVWSSPFNTNVKQDSSSGWPSSCTYNMNGIQLKPNIFIIRFELIQKDP